MIHMPPPPFRSAVKEVANRLLRTGMTAEQTGSLIARAMYELVPDAAKSGAERTRRWRERKHEREAKEAAEAEIRSQMRGRR